MLVIHLDSCVTVMDDLYHLVNCMSKVRFTHDNSLTSQGACQFLTLTNQAAVNFCQTLTHIYSGPFISKSQAK